MFITLPIIQWDSSVKVKKKQNNCSFSKDILMPLMWCHCKNVLGLIWYGFIRNIKSNATFSILFLYKLILLTINNDLKVEKHNVLYSHASKVFITSQELCTAYPVLMGSCAFVSINRRALYLSRWCHWHICNPAAMTAPISLWRLLAI